MYEGHFVLTVTWPPPLLAERKAVGLLFDDNRKPDSKPRQFSVPLESFQKNVQSLEERLSTVSTYTNSKPTPTSVKTVRPDTMTISSST